MELVVERCAGLDVHKDTVMACVRRPGSAGGRHEEVREFRSFTNGLVALRDWLAQQGVTQVAMEATGVYWRPVWYVLEGGGPPPGWELLLVNAAHVKNLPGRKTDVADAAWLAQLLECGLLRGSFVPTAVMGRLRDLTRYRTKLVQQRAQEILRVQKTLEDAGIKLDSVASDVMGVSGRAMIDALIAGERDPKALAELARGRLRSKIPELRQALQGRFGDHHALMLRLHLDHIDHLGQAIERIEGEVDDQARPFAAHIDRLATIPGVGLKTAWTVIAEIGVDMTRFPTADHLASWAGLCPGNHESAGKRRSGKARKGNAALRAALVEAAWASVRAKNSYLGAQYRRFLRRFGRKNEAKALFAVAHTLIVIIWHVLADHADYHDLGPDYFTTRNDAEAHKRRLIRQLETLTGSRVTLQPAA